MRIDLHGCSLDDAVDEILYSLDECKELQDFLLEIIHGYRHGSNIREYVRSNGFLKEMASKGYNLSIKSASDSGLTILELKLTRKFQKIKSTSNYCNKCNMLMRPLKLDRTYICPKCGKFKKI